MKENFKKLFVVEEIKDEVNSVSEKEKLQKKEIQYDLFNTPGEANSYIERKLSNISNSSKFYQKNESELSLKLLFKKLENQDLVSLNTINLEDNIKTLGLSFSWGNNKSYFLKIKDSDYFIIENLKSFFNKRDLSIVGYD